MPTENSMIFISYARADAEFALRLAKDLKSAGANIWLDQLNVLKGERWDKAIQKGLRESEFVVVILSPKSVASENVLDEVSYAFDEGKQILPILYKKCDVPFRLRRLQYTDFSRDYNTRLAELVKGLKIDTSSETLKTRKEPSRTNFRKLKAGPKSIFLGILLVILTSLALAAYKMDIVGFFKTTPSLEDPEISPDWRTLSEALNRLSEVGTGYQNLAKRAQVLVADAAPPDSVFIAESEIASQQAFEIIKDFADPPSGVAIQTRSERSNLMSRRFNYPYTGLVEFLNEKRKHLQEVDELSEAPREVTATIKKIQTKGRAIEQDIKELLNDFKTSMESLESIIRSEFSSNWFRKLSLNKPSQFSDQTQTPNDEYSILSRKIKEIRLDILAIVEITGLTVDLRGGVQNAIKQRDIALLELNTTILPGAVALVKKSSDILDRIPEWRERFQAIHDGFPVVMSSIVNKTMKNRVEELKMDLSAVQRKLQVLERSLRQTVVTTEAFVIFFRISSGLDYANAVRSLSI